MADLLGEMAASRKPARKTKSKKPTTPARKRRVMKAAAAILVGAPLAPVAREEGVSRAQIHRDGGEARQIIAGLVDANISDIKVLFITLIVVIRDAMGARRAEKLADGRVIDIGPDHYARLTAAKRFFELLTAGRPAPRAQEEKDHRGITWAQMQALLKQSE